MAAITLTEYVKTVSDPAQRFVINEFLQSRLFQVFPFFNVTGGGYFYDLTTKLTAVGFRGINENYVSEPGVMNPQSEALKLFGGDIKTDVALVDRYGAGRRSVEIQMAVEAARLEFEKTFFKGDSVLEPREFDGLQKRIIGTQLISNGSDDTGNPLSINSLKEAIDQVKAGTGRKYMFCNDTVKRRLENYYEGTANGMLRYQVNEVGQEIMMFRGCEIIVIEDDELGNAILPFTETSPDGTSTTNNTSIYITRFGETLCTGIQGPSNGVQGIYVEDFGRIEAEPKYLTRVAWDCGMVVANGRSVARLAGVQDGVATA